MTKGHTDILNRALPLFDKIVVGIGVNSNKQPMFSLDQRMAWIREIYQKESKVEVSSYEGLTIHFCEKIQASYILRGIRSIGDFEYEKAIADMNRILKPDLETIFIACSPEYSFYSSTIVRDVIRNGGDYHSFLPSEVKI